MLDDRRAAKLERQARKLERRAQRLGLDIAVSGNGGEGMNQDDLSMDPIEAKVRRRIQQRNELRISFIAHLIVYLVMNAMFWGIWVNSHGGFPWPMFITIGWGSGL